MLLRPEAGLEKGGAGAVDVIVDVGVIRIKRLVGDAVRTVAAQEGEFA